MCQFCNKRHTGPCYKQCRARAECEALPHLPESCPSRPSSIITRVITPHDIRIIDKYTRTTSPNIYENPPVNEEYSIEARSFRPIPVYDTRSFSPHAVSVGAVPRSFSPHAVSPIQHSFSPHAVPIVPRSFSPQAGPVDPRSFSPHAVPVDPRSFSPQPSIYKTDYVEVKFLKGTDIGPSPVLPINQHHHIINGVYYPLTHRRCCTIKCNNPVFGTKEYTFRGCFECIGDKLKCK